MAGEPLIIPKDWRVSLSVGLERAGKPILSPGRLQLLEALERCRGISTAARDIGISYRHAWLQVQAINEAAGEPLVVASTGGRRGGGARLTPLGRWAVAVLHEVQEQLRQTAVHLLERAEPRPRTQVVHVLAAASVDQVLEQLLTDYAIARPDIRVRLVLGASDELADLVLAGTRADVFVSASPVHLDRLEAAGLLEPASRRILARNTLAAIAPADSRFHLRRPAELARPTIRRIALADPACPLGAYTHEYLKHSGLYDAVKPRAMQLDSSRSVIAAVRAGRADVGVVYGSDAVHATDCRRLFRIRPVSAPIQFVAALIQRGQPAEPARSLLAFLASPSARRRFRGCGFLLASHGADDNA